MPKEKYEIKGKLGEGGTASVYFVVPKSGGKGYAFKVLSDLCSQENLMEEMRILQKIRSRYVPKVVSYVEIEGKQGLLMEYKGGLTLEQYLKKYGSMSEAQILRLGIDLCSLLVGMHERNRPICYLDLKPANIILKEDRLLALVDFGCAKEAEPDGRVLSSGKGTRRYAAPEQFGISQKLGPEADIYTLGMVLLEAAGESALSEQTSALLACCVKQDVKDRIPSARMLRWMLKKVYKEHFKKDKALQKGNRNKKLIIFAMFLSLVCFVGAFVMWSRKRSHDLFAEGWELWNTSGDQEEKKRGCELCKESLEYMFLQSIDRERAEILAGLSEYYDDDRNPDTAVKELYRLICCLELNESSQEELLHAVQEFSGAYYRMGEKSFPESDRMLSDVTELLEDENIFNSAEDSLRAKELLEVLNVIGRTKKGNLQDEIYK